VGQIYSDEISQRWVKIQPTLTISRLRAEVARLRIEAEILKKAAAYFAKESL
jgi:transposase-like protein